MDAKSEVILRHDHWQGRILLVNPPRDQLFQSLQSVGATQISVWTWNFADHNFYNNHLESTFDVQPKADDYDQIIIFIPKAKTLLDYILAQCIRLLGIGKSIYLVGEKKAGIERSAKQLPCFGKTIKLDSARHCQLWQLVIDKLPSEKASHLETWIKRYPISINDETLQICGLPGVFSQDHLDIGTAQLLPYLKHVKSGAVLDFGCGAGIISAVLAKQDSSRKITAVDIDAFALCSTELTFAENQLSEQLTTLAITDIQDISDQFDVVVSNPPFHQGIKTNYQASENLCKFAKQRLRPQGELWIVANRFLNYPSLIEAQFAQCMQKADSQGFKVLYAQS